MHIKVTSDLSTYNPNYKFSKNKIVRILWYLTSLTIFQSYLFPFYNIKRSILLIFGAQIGSNFIIKPNVIIKYPWNLKIGNNVWIGEKVWIDNLDMITINNSVCISQSAYLLTGNHNYKSQHFDLKISPIVINDGVWICANATICPGVTINSNAVISVGSVLMKDAISDKIYMGNPAIPIKERV